MTSMSDEQDANILAITVAKFLARMKMVSDTANVQILEDRMIVSPIDPQLKIQKIIVFCNYTEENFREATFNVSKSSNERSCYMYIFKDYYTVREVINTLKVDIVKLMELDILITHHTGIVANLQLNDPRECYYLKKKKSLEANQLDAINSIKNDIPSTFGVLQNNKVKNPNCKLKNVEAKSYEEMETLHFTKSNEIFKTIGVTYIFVVYRDAKIYNRNVSDTLYIIKTSDRVHLLTYEETDGKLDQSEL
jgi:hypothetical protein